MDTVNKIDRQPQRLFVLIIVSVAIHGGILFLYEFKEDVLLTRATTAEHVFRINLAIPRQDHIRIKVPGRLPDAWQLIERSRDDIRLQETDRATYWSFDNLPADSNLDVLGISVMERASVTTYRVFSGGNIRVKLASLLGGVQCFEILEPDLLDEFSSGVWMLIRC